MAVKEEIIQLSYTTLADVISPEEVGQKNLCLQTGMAVLLIYPVSNYHSVTKLCNSPEDYYKATT